MAVVMANLRTALCGARPVVASMVAFLPRKIGRPVILRSGQNVMPVRPIATPVDQIAILIQSRSFDDVRVYVKLIEVDGDQFASGVVPGADPIRSRAEMARPSSTWVLRYARHVRPVEPPPRRASCMGIGPFKAPSRALAHADTRDKEPHGVLVCRKERRTRQGQNSERGQDPENVHVSLPIPDRNSPLGASQQLKRYPIHSERQVTGTRPGAAAGAGDHGTRRARRGIPAKRETRPWPCRRWRRSSRPTCHRRESVTANRQDLSLRDEALSRRLAVQAARLDRRRGRSEPFREDHRQ